MSALFTALATQLDDPVERLEAIRLTTKGAKTEHNAVGATMLQDWAEFAGPNVFNLASRLYSSMNLADAHRPLHNIVVSNVPGPPFPLYFAGAEMVAAYPMGPVMEGCGLNVTVFSYLDSIDVGFMVDKELVPDVWAMAEAVEPALAELVAAAGVDLPTSATAPDEAEADPPSPARRRSSTKPSPAPVAPVSLPGPTPASATSTPGRAASA